MTLKPAETRRLIKKAGGDLAFARLMGIDERKVKHIPQLVHNWKQRGLPVEVQLRNYEKLKELRESLAKPAAEAVA